MANVLLLREPAKDGPDRYEQAFKQVGYHPVSIPVLATVHDDVNNLVEIVKNGPETYDLGGVVITSKRSCEAWGKALSDIRKSQSSHSVGLSHIFSFQIARFDVFPELWSHVPFYVVGEATANSLRQIFSDFADLGLAVVDVRGQSSGNAATLSTFILDDLKTRPVRLLYLTGDKNRDTLSKALEGGGISLHSIQVYRTVGSPTFERDLALGLASLPQGMSNSCFLGIFN